MGRLIPKAKFSKNGTEPDTPRAVLATPPATQTADDDIRGAVGETWTGRNMLTTKLATVGLWMLIASGPIALVVAMAAAAGPERQASAPPAEPDLSALTEQSASGREAAEFAQSFVVTWLTTPRGEEARLSAFGVDGANVRLSDVPAKVSNGAVAAFSEVTDDVWTVRVGIDVVWPGDKQKQGTDEDGDAADADETGNAPTTNRQYFQVTIENHDGTLAAQTLPAAVPRNDITTAPRLAYRDRLAPGDEAHDTAAGFLGALLAADGDLSRYIAPNADLVPVTPPPYAGIEMHDVQVDHALDPQQDGTTMNVLATASAITAGGQHVEVQYPLVMTARDGRWEVVEISSAALTSANPPVPKDETP